MENKWRGCSAQGRDLGKRKMVLWFRRQLCACAGCLGPCVPLVRVWVAACGAWEVLGGGHRLRSECRGVLSEIQRTLRSAPSFPVPRTRKH